MKNRLSQLKNSSLKSECHFGRVLLKNFFLSGFGGFNIPVDVSISFLEPL